MKTLYFKLRPLLFLAMGISVGIFVHGITHGLTYWKYGLLFVLLFGVVTTVLHGMRDKFAE